MGLVSGSPKRIWEIADNHGRTDMKTIRLTAELIEEEEGGYSVYCPELDIYTQGETEDECVANLREAANLHLEELGERAALRKVIRREIEISAHV